MRSRVTSAGNAIFPGLLAERPIKRNHPFPVGGRGVGGRVSSCARHLTVGMWEFAISFCESERKIGFR